MRVAISGATGFIGSALARDLADSGIDVVKLVRRPARSDDEIGWDSPETDALDPAALAHVDAVVHLAGAPLFSGRWTQRRKARLRASRIAPTKSLASAMAATDDGPRVLLCASGSGYYGATGNHVVDEAAPRGAGFIAELAGDWEAATAAASAAGVRVALLRSGVVIGPGGGMLGALVPPFRFGLGARIGSGQQYLTWISLEDEVRAIRFLLDTSNLDGPVNLTAPEAVTNAEFTRALAAALHRPAFLRLPASALRLALGEVATELLASARVRPTRLVDAGFRFARPEIGRALAALA